MDVNKNVDHFPPISYVFLTYLQQRSCVNNELKREIECLKHQLKPRSVSYVVSDNVVNTKAYVFDSNIECDGELETDGHSITRSLIQDFGPQVELALPGSAEDAHAVREVAAELIRIADDFNENIIAQAAEHLTKKLANSSAQYWWSSLSEVVDGLLKDIPGVHTERVVMALTFSLVKAVCERAPRLLRGLLNIMLQYTFPARPR